MIEPQEASETLCQEILSEARQRGAEILQSARKQAAVLLAQASTEAEKLHEDRMQQANIEAERRRRLVLATIVVEAGRLRAERIESLLESIHDQIRERLSQREGFDYRSALSALALAGLRAIDTAEATIQLSPQDMAAFGKGLVESLARQLNRSPATLVLSSEPTITPGVIIKDTAGRQICDNRLLARLERLWPALRPVIAIEVSLLTHADRERSIE
jgi:V/A-type H+-transporting ATPase subunit E